MATWVLKFCFISLSSVAQSLYTFPFSCSYKNAFPFLTTIEYLATKQHLPSLARRVAVSTSLGILRSKYLIAESRQRGERMIVFQISPKNLLVPTIFSVSRSISSIFLSCSVFYSSNAGSIQTRKPGRHKTSSRSNFRILSFIISIKYFFTSKAAN